MKQAVAGLFALLACGPSHPATLADESGTDGIARFDSDSTLSEDALADGLGVSLWRVGAGGRVGLLSANAEAPGDVSRMPEGTALREAYPHLRSGDGPLVEASITEAIETGIEQSLGVVEWPPVRVRLVVAPTSRPGVVALYTEVEGPSSSVEVKVDRMTYIRQQFENAAAVSRRVSRNVEKMAPGVARSGPVLD